MRVTSISTYPVKGLGAMPLADCTLVANQGVPSDRRFALTHRRTQFDFDKPEWIARRNFLVVAHSPKLAMLRASFDADKQTLLISRGGTEVFECTTPPATDHKSLDDFFADYADSRQPGPFHLVQVPETSLTDSPIAAVSLMNTASLRELQNTCALPLDPARMRGNVWFESTAAWQELDLIGAEVTIGNAILKVIEPVERCAAINACPQTGNRNINVLKTLTSHYGHAHFGVLAVVIKGGTFKHNDLLRVKNQNG